MAHAEPVYYRQAYSLNDRHSCGRLKHLWQHGYKLTRVCLYIWRGGATYYKV